MKTGKRILSVMLTMLLIFGTISFALPINAENETSYQVGDIIDFGTYPQSQVTNENLIAKLDAIDKRWVSYKYYVGTGSWNDGNMAQSDYMQYTDFFCDGVKYRAVVFSSYRPLETGYPQTAEKTHQDNNGYIPNSVYYFKYEPLKWRVLDPLTGYILCDNVIDSQCYHNTVFYSGEEYWQDKTATVYANDYASSSIRAWLNDDFYETAFTTTQKNNISLHTWNNDAYSATYKKYDSVNTSDRISMLSWADTKYSAFGLTKASARKASGTAYAKCQGVNTSNGISWYWLRSATKKGHFASGIRSDGSTESEGYVNSTRRGIRPVCYLKTLYSNAETSNLLFSETKEAALNLPENYDFTKDSYSFPNAYSVNLKYKYYANLFDPATAFLLYLSHRKLIGLCFGFSYTTAAIFNGFPRVSNFYKGNSTDDIASTIRELGIRSELVKGSSSLENKKVYDSFRVLDYAVYAHLYQFSPRVAKTEKQTMNKIGELYHTVKAYTQENKLGVTIGMNMRNSPDCHRVLAVGIDGKDILIDDPNDPTKLKRIEINGNQWSFGSGKYNSESADIMYNTDILEPYRILTGARFLAPAKTNRIVDNLKSDTGYCLLKIEADKFNLDTEEFYEIPFAEGFEQEDDSPLYWIENNNTVHISDVENGGRITAAADDIILATSSEKKSSVEMSLNETKDIILDTEKDSKVSFSYSTVDEELNETKVSISGIANTDKILAIKTEDGYQVSGVNDISVVYYQNDEVKAKTDAEVKDGREVSISVSDNGDAVSTDFETVHTHADDNNDGKCDACNQQMTGGNHCKYCGKIHGGAFGWLVKFFHSIFAIFKR